VSHDRVFLDNVVTSTIAFEGGGDVREYVGGYQDWLRQRDIAEPAPARSGPRTSEAVRRTNQADAQSRLSPDAAATGGVATRKKLSYKEQRELEGLPAAIEALEREQADLQRRVADPAFYREAPAAITATLARLEELEQLLTKRYARWDELDSRT
jgi:ATP-binding cassette subfamily F protein uup